MDFNEVIKERYSCKDFSSKEVEEEKLLKILEAGRLAPTAKNLQEAKVYILKSQEALLKMDQLTPCRYHAPIVLMVTYNQKNVFTYPGGLRDSGVEDATIVATHLLLASTNVGLDSCWINFFNPSEAKCLFNLPEEEEVLMFLDLGYAKEKKPLPNHTLRKDLKETTQEL